MEYFKEFAAVPAIVAICYVLAEIYKAVVSEAWYKLIPVLCALLGCGLGLVGYLCIPGFIPADNAITAAAVGMVSGWAATGANQAYKQIKEE